MRKRPFPKFIWKMSGMIFFFVGLCGRMRGEGWLVVGNHCLFLKSVTDGAALFYGCLMILCGVNCWPVCEFCFSLGEQMVSSANGESTLHTRDELTGTYAAVVLIM